MTIVKTTVIHVTPPTNNRVWSIIPLLPAESHETRYHVVQLSFMEISDFLIYFAKKCKRDPVRKNKSKLELITIALNQHSHRSFCVIIQKDAVNPNR